MLSLMFWHAILAINLWRASCFCVLRNVWCVVLSVTCDCMFDMSYVFWYVMREAWFVLRLPASSCIHTLSRCFVLMFVSCVGCIWCVCLDSTRRESSDTSLAAIVAALATRYTYPNKHNGKENGNGELAESAQHVPLVPNPLSSWQTWWLQSTNIRMSCSNNR